MESAAEFQFIAGLGNPGSKYELTRHNIGFMLLDYLVSESAPHGVVAGWKDQMGALVSEVRFGGCKVIVAKPQKYMNLSGEPVQQLLRFYKIEAEDLLVVHDDVDIPYGSLRLRRGGGVGGHNGLKSISSALGSNNYLRLRMGVGRPDVEEGVTQRELSSWVLSRFDQEEQKKLPELLSSGARAVEELYERGLKDAQNYWNGS